jgi:hypothetical protein
MAAHSLSKLALLSFSEHPWIGGIWNRTYNIGGMWWVKLNFFNEEKMIMFLKSKKISIIKLNFN